MKNIHLRFRHPHGRAAATPDQSAGATDLYWTGGRYAGFIYRQTWKLSNTNLFKPTLKTCIVFSIRWLKDLDQGLLVCALDCKGSGHTWLEMVHDCILLT